MANERCNVWEHPLSIWKTKSQYFVWLRGNLRQIWSDNPLRKQWKSSQLRPVTKQERLDKVFHPSTKNVGQCVLCENWFAGSKLECDHVIESEGCYDFETAEKFLWHCAADNPENWALVCKPCHKIKSYSQKEGLTFTEAIIEKEVIAICNGDDKAWITSKGHVPESNAKKRRDQIRKIIKEESVED